MAPFASSGSKEGGVQSAFERYDDGVAGDVRNQVEMKYMGTAADQREMQGLGRIQQLRRNFQYVSVLGFGCTLIGTWEFMLGFIGFGLTDGGTAGLIYGFIVVFFGFLCVYLSIAEMASMAPTSGGQYHWVSEFAPASSQKFLSYLSGYLVAAGWQFSIVSTAFLAGTILQGLLILNYDNYVYEGWHGTLLVIAVTVFCIVFNVFLAKRLPFIEGVLLVIYIVGFFLIIIPLWVLAPRTDSKVVFTKFNNDGGWDSLGTAVLVGLSGIVPSLAGFDCAVHMAEEIKDASVTLPRSIVSGVIVNGIMGFIMAITICFTLGDVQSILNTPTKYPFIQLFFNATKSYAATNAMTSMIIIVFTSAVISEIATSSRQLWSFARDGGFPASPFIAKIDSNRNIPLNAIIVSFLIVALVSLINIGSSVALNAINSITISALMSSYILTIGCLIYRRLRGDPLPRSRWSLGRWGMAVNIASMIFLMPMFVFAFFPLAMPVQPDTMNWGCLLFGGVIIIAGVYYAAWGHKVYTPPVRLLKREQYDT